MNFKISLAVFLALVAVSLIGFAFSLIGVAGSAVDSVWKLIALSIGLALVGGFVYPFVRGVKKGDVLSTTSSFIEKTPTGQIISMLAMPTAVAMQSGRVSSKILIQLPGRQAEGVIVSYASTFSPATIRIVEIEQIPAGAYRF